MVRQAHHERISRGLRERISPDWKFGAEQADAETSYVYQRGPYYDPALGRTINGGRSWGPGAAPRTLNRYLESLAIAGTGPDPAGNTSIKSTELISGHEARSGIHNVGTGGAGSRIGTQSSSGVQLLVKAMELVPSRGLFGNSNLMATDAFGLALGIGMLIGSGGSRRSGPEGTVIFEDLGGALVNAFRDAAGGFGGRPFAVAIGHVILNSGAFHQATQAGAEWLAHELGHVRQAEILGDGYLPMYLGMLAAGDHESHPWEQAADIFSGLHWRNYMQ